MKKIIIGMFAFATICTVSCKKENVTPANELSKKIMKSGGGDKRPSGTYD